MPKKKLHVNFKKHVPYPIDVVLSQYYDYEHIEFVHPDTLGKYVLLEENDDRVVYEQIWPRTIFGQARSVVEQRFIPPNEIWFEFTDGRHKGIQVHTFLYEAEGGTTVDETYIMNLPNWRWLAALSKPFIVKQVNKIWDEDIHVDVCRDGWPGIPENAITTQSPVESTESNLHETVTDVPDGEARVFHQGEIEIAVFNHEGQLYALENRCPHTGAPLVLGKIHNNEIICPWHGAQFTLAEGTHTCGPSDRNIKSYPVQRVNGKIEIEWSADPD